MTDERERKYEAELGSEALARQQQAAKELHRCCAEWKGGPHHVACRNFVEEELPPVIPGQEALL